MENEFPHFDFIDQNEFKSENKSGIVNENLKPSEHKKIFQKVAIYSNKEEKKVMAIEMKEYLKLKKIIPIKPNKKEDIIKEVKENSRKENNGINEVNINDPDKKNFNGEENGKKDDLLINLNEKKILIEKNISNDNNKEENRKLNIDKDEGLNVELNLKIKPKED